VEVSLFSSTVKPTTDTSVSAPREACAVSFLFSFDHLTPTSWAPPVFEAG
jgi:hypothetical protein